MSKTQFLSPKSQAGQAIVLIAFMIIVLFGAIGLAVDGGIAYYYNSGAERAAASAALAGVIFMPNQLAPCCGGNNATDRALLGARRNGFDAVTNGVPNGPNNVTVTVSTYTDPISGIVQPESLQVTVSRTVGTFFMQLFGISTVKVSRTAVAQYLKPLKLGEPCLYPGQAPGAIGDCHTGATVSQLGNGGYYFLRTEGWATDRGQGDAYTPHNIGGPAPEYDSTDVHAISAAQGTDVADASLPDRGGYNYILTVPAGRTAQLQVYNAAFAADGGGTSQNFCDNWLAALAVPWNNYCSPGGDPVNGCLATGGAAGSGCPYYMHEDDTAPYANPNLYSAMRYTIYAAPSAFIRSSDTILSQMTVRPIDARNWNATPPTYQDPNNPGVNITQTYNVLGRPTNMLAYHAWMDVGSYVPNTDCLPNPPGTCSGTNEAESAIITYNPRWNGGGPLPAGTLSGGASGATYRLRIDTLQYNATGLIQTQGVAGGNSQAHKGMSVRVVDGATGNAPCGSAGAPCSLSALDDIAIYTPINTVGAGTTFKMPVFAVPATYAGLTISVDIFDAGDAGGASGAIFIGFIDPTSPGCTLFQEPAGGATATVVDLGGQRVPPFQAGFPAVPTGGPGVFPPGTPLEQQVNNGAGTINGDNRWYRYTIPIPNTYAPGAVNACDPTGQGYWQLQYRVSPGTVATDTITITVNLRGNPAHILKS